MIKADLRCAAVAAASVLAKVERDRIMVERARDFPGYGWEENKGYSAPEHGDALRRLGACAQHRRSWSLPGHGGLTPDCSPCQPGFGSWTPRDWTPRSWTPRSWTPRSWTPPTVFVLPEPAGSSAPPGRPRPAAMPAAP